ncbi:MAG: GNAT family N-acetyltransferase [Hyphomicrobiaceae bacterium]|nr:GNAT family N-acetyltransferase [Hyphomicrobiaceae bacterium]
MSNTITSSAASDATYPRLLPALDVSGAPGLRLRPAAVVNAHLHAGFRIEHHTSIAEIGEDAWNRLFPDAAEDWGYFRGCERSGSSHFTFSALAAYEGNQLVAAAPVFRLDYRLDMTLPPRLKAITEWIGRIMPRLAKVPVIGMGSPMTEECPIGIDASLSPARHRAAFDALLVALHRHAKSQRVKILALKDVTDADAQWADPTIAAQGFARMASLPLATLPLPFATFDDYLKSMPSRRRSDIRSKLKAASGIETEMRDNIEDIYDDVIALYRATRANRKASYEAFDEVPEAYFREVMRNGRGKARALLCRHNGKLVSFALFLVEKDKVIAKFIGMDYAVARSLNLYFFNWMTIVRFCIENGIPALQTGQTTYTVKVKLGSKMKRSWIHFKHTGLVLGWVLRKIGPLVSFEAADPDLKVLGDAVTYLAADA